METILYTKSNNLIVKTCYFGDAQEFGTCIEYPDGKIQVMENFKSALFLLDIHDFWCKFTGVIKGSTTIEEVNRHIRKVS